MGKIILLIAVGLVVSGCAGKITDEEMKNAYCGPFPQNYKQIIKVKFKRKLDDPHQARYHFFEPQKDWMRVWFSSGKVECSWLVCGEVSSKNYYGEYIQPRPFYVKIKDGQIIHSTTNFNTDNSFRRSAIIGACPQFRGR